MRKTSTGKLSGLRNSSAVEPGLPNAHLQYFGGPVVSNVEVVVVFWGSSVDSATTSGIGGFYQVLVTSSFMDLFSEFNTTGFQSGTNQTIGRGTLKGTYVVTPSNTASSLSDTQVQTELVAQVTAGHLPTPTTDAGGNLNTAYMIYFPPGITISDASTGTSCVDYCAYHSATDNLHLFMGENLYYSIYPDFGPASGCHTGCGTAATTFENLTSTSTHELAETITDGQVSLAPSFAAPLAWYDTHKDAQNNDYGEIADICNQSQGIGPSGYVVQLVWSNLQNECVEAPAQFVLSSPATVTAGVPFNLQVTAQDSAPILLSSYKGTVTFSSGDGAATLPQNFTFTSGDAGTHMFSVTLQSPGMQTVTASDTHAITVLGTTSVNVIQATINVMIGTFPAGPSFSVDGTVYTSAQILQWTPGSTHTIAATSPQSGSPGQQFVFKRWSDGGALSHTVIAPNASAGLTVYFDDLVNPQRPGRPTRPALASPGVVTNAVKSPPTATTRHAATRRVKRPLSPRAGVAFLSSRAHLMGEGSAVASPAEARQREESTRRSTGRRYLRPTVQDAHE